MSDKTFHLEILTPERTIYAGEVVSLTAPGGLGSLGVLANHAPLVTTLTPGKIAFREASGGSKTMLSAGEGFLEVYKNRATLLADAVTA